MTHLIDKDALVAEIERLRKNNKPKEDKDYAQFELDVSCGYDMALDDVEKFLDTLEVKVVDLDEEIDRWQGYEAFPEGVRITPLPKAMEIVKRTAKHFFELGMQVSSKAQKGEKYDTKRINKCI